jgi:formylmethanofuran dehydrogenase subunit B
MAAWVNGAPSDRDGAIAAARMLLLGARCPVIAGLSCDVEAIRAAYRLAQLLGASLDPVAGPGLYADLAAFASSGAMTTTPSEAIARADVILAIGAAASRSAIFGEIAASMPSMGRAAGKTRSLLVLGGGPEAAAAYRAYSTEPYGLAASLGLVRALAGGRLAAEIPLADLARELRAALFGVALYDPAELGDLAVEMLHGLVKDLNETTRFFGLALAAPWQGQTALQVGAWTTAQGPRVGFGPGYPEHDPWRFEASRQVQAGEADAALWLAALPAPQPAWTRDVPTVALLGEATGGESEIVISVGVPGETTEGVLWDERRAALVFRPARRSAESASAAAVLDALGASLDCARQAAC